MIRTATYLTALLLGLICATAGQAKSLFTGPCENFFAPDQVTPGQIITRKGNIRISADNSPSVVIIEDGIPVIGDVLPVGAETMIGTIFEQFGGNFYLSVQTDVVAVLRFRSGRTVQFQAGRVLSDFELSGPSLRRTKCVRVTESPVMVGPSKARSMGYDVISGSVVDLADEDDKIIILEAPEPDTALSSLFDGSDTDPSEPTPSGDGTGDLTAALAASGTEPDKSGEGDNDLSNLFAQKDEIETVPLEPAEAADAALRDEVNAALEAAGAVTDEEPAPGNMVCNVTTGAQLPLMAMGAVPDYAVAATLGDSKPLTAFRLIPFTEDIVADPLRARVADPTIGQMVLIGQPFGLRGRQTDGGENTLITQLLDTSVLTFDAAPAAAPPSANEVIRLLVAADASTLAVSGLDRLEEDLLAWSGRRMWRVDWAEITSDGVVLEPVTYDSLTQLVASVAGREDAFAPLEDAQFDKLLDGLTRQIAAPGMPVSKLLWLIEGYPLPHTAPVRFDRMIRDVNADGNVDRRSNGRARKWLEVIAGTFSTPFASYYLDGPIQTNAPGYMTQEQRDGPERDVILTHPKDIATRLKLSISFVSTVETPAAAPAVTEVNTDGLVFDRAGLVEQAGLLVARPAVPALLQSLSTTEVMWGQIEAGAAPLTTDGVIDALSLAALRTSEDGTLVTRSLSAKDLKRRLSLARSRPNGADTLAAQRGWLTAVTARALANMNNTSCDYLFFPDSGL